MGDTEDKPMSRWAQRKEAKANMYLTSTEGNKAVRRTHAKDAAPQQCQKCLKTGHWTYECKTGPIYTSRVSKTKQLKNPKLRKFNLELPPDELEKKIKQQEKEKAEKKLTAKKKKTKKKRDVSSSSDSSSSSSSSDSSDSESDSNSSSGSDSDSDSSSASSSSSSSSGSSSSSSGSSSSSSSEDEKPLKKRAKKSSG